MSEVLPTSHEQESLKRALDKLHARRNLIPVFFKMLGATLLLETIFLPALVGSSYALGIVAITALGGIGLVALVATVFMLGVRKYDYGEHQIARSNRARRIN